jgi:HAD superfamily hydrolase (TIGR01509 family)
MAWLLFDLNGTLLDPGDKLPELKQAVTLAMATTLSGDGYRPFSDFIPDPPDPKLFDDVEDGLAKLGARHRLAVLTNSSRDDAEQKLEATGIRDCFEFVAGTDEVRVFKPHPRVYELGIERTGVDYDQFVMVAAHPWDLLGARRAGLLTAYLARDRSWPEMLDRPDWEAPDLQELAPQLL